jgi:hypothetical protein
MSLSHGEAAVSPERWRAALHLDAVRRARDPPAAASAAASVAPAGPAPACPVPITA